MNHKIPKNTMTATMKQKKYCALTMTLFSFFCYNQDDTEKLYSTSFLKDYKAVQKYLKKIASYTRESQTRTAADLVRFTELQ